MVADKLVDSSQLDGALIATANAIRAYNSEASSVKKTWDDDTGFSSIIAHMTDQASGTAATASTMLNGKVAYVNGTKITGSIATKTSSDLTATDDVVYVPAGYYASQASKSVGTGSVTVGEPTINSSTGLVTATATVTAGYLDSQTKSNTLQLTAKGAATYNTSTEDQTIAAGQYLTGAQTIRQVKTVNIEAGNIKYGVNVKVGDAGNSNRIANVTGTFTKANTVSSGQSAASASQILDGYSAWVDGAEVQGSIQTQTISQGTTTVSGTTATRGTASWDTGFIEQGSISAATFASSATSGKTYVDISNTTSAPVLVSGNYLYINKGYTDDLKISLAKLVPDAADVGVATTSGSMLNGFTAYNNNGQIVTGTIQDLQSSDISVNASTNVITIPIEKYTTGTSITTSMSSGAYHATASISTQGKVTPKVTIDAAATSSYGFTTTKPSGTSGTNYLTLDPNADIATDGKVTPKAYIDTAGHVAANSTGTAGTIITVNPTINAGTNYYVPIVGVTLGGGGLTTATNTNTVGTAPVVTIASSGTFKSASTYGVTTTKPSGTDGTNYLTIDGTGTPTNGKATSTVNVTRAAVTYTNDAGAISANSGVSGLDSTSTGNITKEVTITPTVTDNFAPLYIPIKTVSFDGGTVSKTDFSKANLAVTLSDGSDKNVANYTVGAKDTTNYPYYVKVSGSTPAVSGTTNVAVTKRTYTVGAGAIAAVSAGTARDAVSQNANVSVNAASGSTYVGFKQATMTVAGTNTVSPTASVSASSNVTLDTTNNGISVTATGGGTASITATATTNAAGYAPASTQLGSATITSGDSATTTTATKYITAISVPLNKSFSLNVSENYFAADTGVVNVTNYSNRTTTVRNMSGGTINLTNYATTTATNNSSSTLSVTNSGTVTVTSGGNAVGNLTVSAYNSSNTLESNKSIVSGGEWVATSVSGNGTYYGRVTVGAGDYSTSIASHSITTAPKVTGALAGTITNVGTTTKPSGTDGTDYWTITPSTTLTTTGKSSATSKATITTAGYIAAGDKTLATADVIDITPTRANGSARYLVKATMTVAGSNVVSPTASVAGNANVTLGTTNNGIAVTATGGGTASVSATATTNAAGYAPASTQLGSATLSAPSKTTTATKYITAVTVPAETDFSLTSAEGSDADGSTITIVNAAKRFLDFTNSGSGLMTNSGTLGVTNSGTLTITNSSAIKVNSSSATAGTLTVSAYNSSGTAENNKSIVSNGKWAASSPTAAGTYYGRVTLSGATVTPSFANTNISTYFNSGTSSSNSISITPNYTNTAGVMAAHSSAQSGTASYYTIKTANPSFLGGGVTGTATAAAQSSTCVLSDSTNTSGISFKTACSATRAAVTYPASATAGWVSKAANAATNLTASTTSLTQKTYYINSVSMPASKTFVVNAGGHAYTFTTDANSKTSIKVDNLLTMQWNDDKQALDFIYT